MLPTFVLFTPVPLRPRADGWSPALQLRFIEAVARGLSVAAAAASVGKNRQTAYALRRRKGAESFAAAWDAAVAFASPAPAQRDRGHVGFREKAPVRMVGARPAPHRPVAPRDDAAARAAYAQLLRTLLGPESDTQARGKSTYSKPNLSNLPRNSVAFRGARLRRPPC